MDSSLRTQVSLLARLGDSKSAGKAWDSFIRTYRPFIMRWCRQKGLQMEDAEDVTQMVLLKLLNRLKHFQYDNRKKFRNYLLTVANNVIIDSLSNNNRLAGAFGTRIGLDEIAESFAQSLVGRHDAEVLEQAKERIQEDFSSLHWQIFLSLVDKGDSPQSVADRYETSIDVVYKSKSRILKALKSTVEQINNEW